MRGNATVFGTPRILAVVALVAGTLAAVNDPARFVLAETITAMKDSADFNYLYTGEDLTDTADWTPPSSGDRGTVVSGTTILDYTCYSNWYTWNHAANFDGAKGWTVELSVKVVSPTDGNTAFGVIVGDGSSPNYYLLGFQSDEIRTTIDSTQFGVVVMTDDFTDVFHTVRIARPTSGGASIWVDGVYAGSYAGLDYAYQRLLFGRVSGTIVEGGRTQIEYIRADTTGAFAPVPEPSVFTLLAVGIFGLLWTRFRFA